MGIDKWEKEHRKRLASIERQIQEIYEYAIQEASALGVMVQELADDIFQFEKYPYMGERVERLLQDLHDKMEIAIVNGVDSEWTLANNKNNELCQRVFGDTLAYLSVEQQRRYFRNNEGAREAFLKRVVNGLGLSDRVWNYTNAYKKELEMGLDVGIRAGMSASEMSRELKSYLLNPDKLFRRVRDKHGNLVLSKAAKAYHPGQGVYRSSYMNARRLAVTETNLAYRTADYDRYQLFDFVVGIEIHLSGNHTCKGVKGDFFDICDELQGKYPKDFKFTGWHPHCRCYTTTILKTPKEIQRDNELIMQGLEPIAGSENEVRGVPMKFKQWQEDNIERAKRSNSTPYFVLDNLQYIDPELVSSYGKLSIPIKWKDEFAQVKGTLSQENLGIITKISQGINHHALEKHLGIKKGDPLTFEQADGRRTNPNHGKGKQYAVNCQTCTIAYELRRRGFNVEAKGNPNEEIWKIIKTTDETLKTIYGTIAEFDMYVELGKKVKSKNKEQLFSDFINSKTQSEGRYELRLRWNSGGGHVVCLERLNGVLIWYDPQTGQKGDRLFRKNEISMLQEAANIGIRRIDDKIINRKMFSRFILK